MIPQNLKILLGLAVLDLAYLGLCQPKPAPQKFLVEPFSEKLEMSRMVSVSLKHLTYVLTFKRGPEFIGIKKSSLSWAGGVRSWSRCSRWHLPHNRAVLSAASAPPQLWQRRSPAACRPEPEDTIPPPMLVGANPASEQGT